MSKVLNYNNQHNNRYLLEVIPDQQVGMGYSDDTQMGTSTFCINATNIQLHGQPVSVIDFGSSMDFSQAQSDLGVDLTANLSMDKFSGSLAAQYAKSMQSSGYSMSYTFVYKINLPTQVIHVEKFGSEALNEFGQAAFKEGLDRFKDVCGNKFIVEEASGAKLYTSLKVEFNSKYDANKFALNFKGSISDLGSAALDIKVGSQSHQISGSITLSAIQEGGNVMKLSEIFGKTTDNNILHCSLQPKSQAVDPDESNIEKCQEVISDIINYAKTDFANQISYNSTGDGKIVGVPTSIGYVYLEYDKVGIDNIHAGLTPEVLSIRNFLGETYDNMQQYITYLSKLIFSGHVDGVMDYVVPMNSPSTIPNWSGQWVWQPELINIEAKAQLDATFANANKVMNALESQYSGAIQCYKDPNNCANVKETIDAAINTNPIANNTIEFFQKSYALSTQCNGVDYGLRFMLPIGQEQKTSYYHEHSEFNLAKNPSAMLAQEFTNKTLINIYGIETMSGSDGRHASLSLNGIDKNCGTFLEENAEDMIAIYSGTPTPECMMRMCPEDQLNQQMGMTITFYEIDSPI